MRKLGIFLGLCGLWIQTHAQDTLCIDTLTMSVAMPCPQTDTLPHVEIQPYTLNIEVASFQNDEDSFSRYHADLPLRANPWRAGMEALLSNGVVWGVDRFALEKPFAYISNKTIKQNFKDGFVWDNDLFLTNLYSHPYQGSFYFNAARSNNLNFWQSLPYTVLGSLTWEYLLEVEPPGLNDFISTTFGGAAAGEIMHRVSALVLDDSQRGANRAGREAVAFLINPMQGFTRLLSGDMWRRRSTNYLYHNFAETPVDMSIGAGYRFLSGNTRLNKGTSVHYIDVSCRYGDIFDCGRTPYDVFQARYTVSLFGSQPYMDRITINGKLFSTAKTTRRGHEIAYGLFQFFNYFDSYPARDDEKLSPFRFAEAASVGGGFFIRPKMKNPRISVQQSIYANAVLMGASLSDYFYWLVRDYNFGLGYSARSLTDVRFGTFARLQLRLYCLHLFTPDGYTDAEKAEYLNNPLMFNKMGDKSDAFYMVINPELHLNVKKWFRITLESGYYFRRTNYRAKPNVKVKNLELKLGAAYVF